MELLLNEKRVDINKPQSYS